MINFLKEILSVFKKDPLTEQLKEIRKFCRDPSAFKFTEADDSVSLYRDIAAKAIDGYYKNNEVEKQ